MDLTHEPNGFRMERLGPAEKAAHRTLICAACGQHSDTVPCAACGRNPLLDARYRLEELLPKRLVGAAYSASDLRRSGRPVHVVQVPVRSDLVDEVRAHHAHWTQALRGVTSVHIEPWSDACLVEAGGIHSLAVVQASDDTPDLSASLGRPMALHQVLHISRSLLGALGALHEVSPPISCGVLNRDRVGVGGDGVVRIFEVGDLERYCATRRSFPSDPPEVRADMWRPASDVHRVAALAVSLLTGRAPIQLTDPRGGWDWERFTNVEPHIADLFSRWLARDPELRPQTASGALRELDATTHLPSPPLQDPPTLERPLHSASSTDAEGMSRPTATPRMALLPATPAAGGEPMVAAEGDRGAHSPRSAPSGRRKAPVTQRLDRSALAPEQRGNLTRMLTLAVVFVLVVATITALQAALTASGTLPGTPWIGMSTPEEGAP